MLRLRKINKWLIEGFKYRLYLKEPEGKMPKRVWLKVSFVDDLVLTIDRQFRHIHLERQKENGESDLIAYLSLIGNEYIDVGFSKTPVRITYKLEALER